MGVLEDIREALQKQAAETQQLREEIASLRERVDPPMKQTYTIKELWLLSGGDQLCSFRAFCKSPHLPQHDGYKYRMRSYRRDTVRKYLSSFTVEIPRARRRLPQERAS